MRKVRYYEDVEIGEEFVSQTRTITESDVVGFAALSDDWSELHISEEFARKAAYGRRIAHGLLGLAITEGLKLRAGADEFAGIASWWKRGRSSKVHTRNALEQTGEG
jgi:acyl dehydratase